jgi:hypothetical protein
MSNKHRGAQIFSTFRLPVAAKFRTFMDTKINNLLTIA